MRRVKHRRPAGPAALLAAVAFVVAGCTSALPPSAANAPVLSVVTGLWPLEQAALAIGGDKAAVDDLVPAGTDPLAYQPGASGTRVLQAAGLVLEVGGGFQPGFEQAARGAPRVTALGSDLKASDPYVWLDPATMERAVRAVAAAMTAANPAAGALYQRNAGGLQAEIQSLQIDYSSTLSTCPGHTIVTPDGAFAAMAGDFQLTDLIVGPAPGPGAVAADRARIDAGSAVGALSQPWTDDTGVATVAQAAGIKVHAIDTLAGAPKSPVAGPDPYTQLMEKDLGTLSGSLGCNNNEQ